MSSLLISGGKKLEGTVEIAGSKNASLALLSAVVMADGETRLRNVPQISDTVAKAKLLERFGVRVTRDELGLKIDCSKLDQGDAPDELVRSIRTSFFLLGPLLARLGVIKLAAPGGCRIGARPVDFHLKGLAAMGAEIDFIGGVYQAKATKLRGAEIYLDFPSAGATQHLMTTATLAEGVTIIENAAMEPEVTTLAAMLNRMGARIEGAGTSKITVQGVRSLSPTDFPVPADRMQAGTYIMAGAITQGDVTVKGIMPEDQTAVVNKLREAGVTVTEGPDWVRVQANQRLKALKIKTMPHPGFPTDMQQPMAALLSLAEGTSTVEETVYEARIGHVEELNRMGAQIRVEGRAAIIQGVESLQGATVEASDLRAGAALVLAGLAAEGETTLVSTKYLDRGYEALEDNLNALGANLRRVESDSFKSGAETNA